jgi:hypothetical protein
MATLEQLSAALIKADAAGNTADATALANEIRRMRSASQAPTQLQPTVSEIPAPRQRLDSGQQIYTAARPYLAPVVEGLTAAGGAIIGAGAGTVASPTILINPVSGGAVGAGIGYGIGKEYMEGLDVLMGVKQPRKGAEIATEPLRNVAEGSTFELGGQLVGKGLGYVAGKVKDVFTLPKNKAADIAREALGPDLPLVLNALKAAKGENVSAGQAAADINSPTFQALMDRASKRDPRFLNALKESQGEVSLNALANLAGGTTAAEARGTLQASKKALNDLTGPQRDAALNRANLGKQVAEYEAQAGKLSGEAATEVQKVRDLISAGNAAEAWARLDMIKRNLPVGAARHSYAGELAVKADEWASKAASASLDLGEGARFAQAAANTLRANGVKPLEGKPLIDSISRIKSNPEYGGNDLIAGAVDNVARDIAQWTAKNGIIDAKALEAIRKNSVTAAIQQLRPGMDATSQRNLAAGVLSDIKPLIDDAIEASGGTGWKQYLNDYTKGMQQIAEKRLSGEALKLFKNNKDEFVKLVTNESPEVVEKFLGKGNYNIATELADSTLATLKTEANKVIRDAKVKSQVEGGQDALKQVLLENMTKFRLPSYLSAVAATTNKALNILENKIGKKTMQYLTEASKSPENAQHLLETLPASERIRVLKLLNNPQTWSAESKILSTGGTAAAVNSLAPDRYNSNALANEPVRVIDTQR